MPTLVQPIDKRAIIIGGSLAGLFAGVLLRTIGWQVDIYERSTHKLDSRGGGVVLQADVIRAFKQAGIATDTLGVDATERYYIQQDGSIENLAMRQTLSSWNILYRSMRKSFADEHYHQGKVLVEVQATVDKATAMFADGTTETADLLIGADGPNSTVRQQLLPNCQPSYAGYVAYRGLVDEADLPSTAAEIFTERFVFYDLPNSHILAYVIPGENESLILGKRRFNWVWYVNYDEQTELANILTDKNGKLRAHSIPPDLMAADVEKTMRDYANLVLIEPFKTLVAATKSPFVQAILDLEVPQMAFATIALIGDAAFIPRPHTAASTAKAAANALSLIQALVTNHHDVNAALQSWQIEQLAYGRQLCAHGQRLGNHSQFSYGRGRIVR